MVEVVGVFDYFICFPDFVGTVAVDNGYDFHFAKVDPVLGCY
jgi:hypothetical protein